MSLFRLTRPLFRPHAIHNSLRQPKVSATFFQPSNPTIGLRNGTSKFSLPQLFSRRAYNQQSFYGPDTEGIKSKMLWGMLGLNAGIFLYVNYLKVQAKQTRDTSSLVTFMQNMSISANGFFNEQRYWTLLTSMFTHVEPFHLLANALSAYFMGSMLVMTPSISPASFLTLVIGSGVAGGVGYLYQRVQKQQQTGGRDYRSAIGFSGAVTGIGAAAACMYPTATVNIYGIIPVPLWLLMAGYLAYDGYYMQKENTGTAHAGHLGGFAFGVLYWFLKLRRGGF